MITSSNQTNRVHAILITKQKKPTLKFIIPCLQYSTRIQCAVFNPGMCRKIKTKFSFLFFRIAVIKTSPLPSFLQSISSMSDSILLFKEESNRPDVVIKDVRKENFLIKY